ncbi:MAG: pseudaminic acid synthase [Candidatus Wildermuthbacteria bacterium]|nr:pseudaminic acid synthase [Candidatus Wildermuthbacteria bacterium]
MNTHPFIEIGGRKIGLDYPCFVVAEMSGNHKQSFETAVEILKAAKKAGADAVKLQTYTPDTMTLDSRKEWFIVGAKTDDKTPDAWRGQALYDLYKIAYTPWEWQPKLMEAAKEIGLMLFSSPFDATAVDFLEKMDVPCYKVASYEANDVPLLKKIASTGKPVILSIGFASLEEVELSIDTLKKNGCKHIAVLHCVTGYTDVANPEEMNLRTITDIRERFGVVSGFSNNNGGIEIPLVSATMGASIIEQHFTLRRADQAIDSTFSLEPQELAEMIRRIRSVEQVLGKVHYGTLTPSDEEKKRFRRGLWVTKDMKKGEKFSSENVRVLRPSVGLEPRFYEEVVEREANQDIQAVTPLTRDLLA